MGERANRYGRPYYHQGVDILAPVGTKLVAPDDGTVVMAGMLHPTGYGRVTLIRVRVGRSNLYVLYAHLSKVLVRKDERVRRGQVVALSGRSGNAAGLPDAEAHVHVEIRTQEKVKSGLDGRIDPLKYFTETTVPKTP
jgi:murein DD-endopeptidase MepM/ murein hydrolase activator NlpD